jgi:mxaC protein
MDLLAPLLQLWTGTASATAGWTLPVDRPLWLLALPLALLPWRAAGREPLAWSWAPLLPADPLSVWLDRGLKAAATLAIGALIVGNAGVYRPAYEVEQLGQGAEVVLLVDRSRSMDQIFMPTKAPDGTSLQNYAMRNERADKSRPSKQMVARRLLAEFAAQRPADRYALVAFSTLPIRVLGFTGKPAAVQAAIGAGQVGRGLAETDIGLALLNALNLFEGRRYNASRIVMLVSDGGDVIEADKQAAITRLVQEQHVTIYWLYIRSHLSPGLNAAAQAETNASTTPEYFLHQFFKGLGTPYRAFEAEDPEALQKAIAEVGRLEQLPITWHETVPRHDRAPLAYAVAALALLLWLGGRWMELRRWA